MAAATIAPAPTNWPSIPAWQQAELAQLSVSNQLSGVTPRALGVIDQAESSGTGGGINSSGYGGWFGLGAGATYPAGSPSPALLGSTTPGAFASQAVIAASAFHQYLGATGGNYVAAEEVYQSGTASGPTEGSKIMAQYGPWPTTPVTATGSPATTASFLTALNPLHALGSAESSFVSFLAKAMLVIAGLGVALLGFYRMASPSTRQKMPDIGKVAELAGVGVGA